MQTTNIAVISDMHISNNADYSWFKNEQASNLIKMLNYAADSSEFDELLILGDAFDLWLYPLNVAPCTFDNVISQWNNTGSSSDGSVIKALENCVKNLPNVFYINGNHDMQVTKEQVESINSGDKHIQWTTPQSYMQRYDNRLHVEHGNAVDMFNAVDTSSDTLNGLPLGYYITRLVATSTDHQSKLEQLGEHLFSFHKEHLLGAGLEEGIDNELGKYFVHSMIDFLMVDLWIKDKRVTDKTEFVFADPGKNVTIGQLKDTYHTLLGKWHTGSWENLLDNILVCARQDGLDWYARRLLNENTPPQAVVFGHTHHRETKTYNSNEYGNDGCWCSSTRDNSSTSIKITITDQDINLNYIDWM